MLNEMHAEILEELEVLQPEGLRRFKPDHVIMREIEDCDVQIETLVAWERNAPSKRVLHFVETCRQLSGK
ncbi:hypothetical protein [Microvirga massiliensis]|uniref:hypothetical protein n=1 Tax=Microvirga massiliensis TaxID=1033741 RepID=UPI000660581C|nr:hypothetical protein [Microvirga massiliensis]